MGVINQLIANYGAHPNQAIPSVNSQICRCHLLHQLHRFLQFSPSAQRRCHAAEAYDVGAAYGSTKEWEDALFSLGNRSLCYGPLSITNLLE